VYRILGYFSLVGLVQLHCSLGDYHRVLETAAAIDLNKKVILVELLLLLLLFVYEFRLLY
jgi:hypothetical protein